MKKLLLILLILQIFCIASFAQEKKPTKQETMDWIAEKINNNINSTLAGVLRYPTGVTRTDTYEFISYDKSVITIKQNMTFIQRDGSEKKQDNVLTIDLTKVKTQQLNSIGDFILYGDKGLNCTKEMRISQTASCSDSFALRLTINDWGNISVMSFEREKDLLDRMQKALDTLIGYNNAEKPKEVF